MARCSRGGIDELSAEQRNGDLIGIGLAALTWWKVPAAKPKLVVPNVVQVAPKVIPKVIPQQTPIQAPQIAVQIQPSISVSSTSYCQPGTMADGQQTYIGAVAGNMWPLVTRLRILSGEHQGEIVTVADRIGHSSQLDFFTWSCTEAWNYGREQISVEVVK